MMTLYDDDEDIADCVPALSPDELRELETQVLK